MINASSRARADITNYFLAGLPTISLYSSDFALINPA
jgi:hypothetical protein